MPRGAMVDHVGARNPVSRARPSWRIVPGWKPWTTKGRDRPAGRPASPLIAQRLRPPTGALPGSGGRCRAQVGPAGSVGQKQTRCSDQPNRNDRFETAARTESDQAICATRFEDQRGRPAPTMHGPCSRGEPDRWQCHYRTVGRNPRPVGAAASECSGSVSARSRMPAPLVSRGAGRRPQQSPDRPVRVPAHIRARRRPRSRRQTAGPYRSIQKSNPTEPRLRCLRVPVENSTS